MTLQGCFANTCLKQHLYSQQHSTAVCRATSNESIVPASLKSRTLIIATRSSQLAQTQSHKVAQLLAAHGISSRLLPINTRGDVPNNSSALSQASTSTTLPVLRDLGPGAFTAELDAAVAEGQADLAVHSLKDSPPVAPHSLVLAACLPREDPRDALITTTGVSSISQLPPGCKLGTASSRRKAQVLALNPAVKVVPMRGNVDSRLQQMSSGAADATLLAVAGLKRLNRTDVKYTVVPTEDMLPAACQGIVGVMARSDDSEACTFLRSHLCDYAALLEATAERSALLQLMDTKDGLRMPDKAVAVLAQCSYNTQQTNSWQLTIDCMIAELDGTWLRRVSDHASGTDLNKSTGLNDAILACSLAGENLGRRLLTLSSS